MGGNDNVALTISKHRRDRRSAQPWNRLLQFFGAAVNYEEVSSSSHKRAAPKSLDNPVLKRLREDIRNIQGGIDPAYEAAAGFTHAKSAISVYDTTSCQGP